MQKQKQPKNEYIPIKEYHSQAKQIEEKYKLNFDITPYLISKGQCEIICDRCNYYEEGSSEFWPHYPNVEEAREKGFTTEQILFLNLLKTPTGIDFDFIKKQVKEKNDNFFKIPTMNKQTFFHSAIAYDKSADILPILNEIKEKCDKENKKLTDYIDFERKDEHYGVKKNILQLALIKTYIYNTSQYYKQDPGRRSTDSYDEKLKSEQYQQKLQKISQSYIEKDQKVMEFLIENSTKGALINKDSEGYNILDYAIYRMDIQNLTKIIERAKKEEFVYELIANSKLIKGTSVFEDFLEKIESIDRNIARDFQKKRYNAGQDILDDKLVKVEEINLFYRHKEQIISFLKQEKQLFLDFFQHNKKIQTAIELYQLKQSLNTKNKEITKLKRQFYKKLPQMLYKNDKIDKRMEKRKQISQKEKELTDLIELKNKVLKMKK